MATDTWLDGTDNWNTPSDWSAGLPGALSDVVINQGNPEVTASFGAVNSIANSATLDFIDAGASSVTNYVRNDPGGVLALDPFSGDGGSRLSIEGTLTNNGTVQIGSSDGSLSAPSTIDARNLTNYGTIDLYGTSTATATLDVRSAAGFNTGGVLFGDVSLSGDALMEFESGQITSIALASTLTLIGSHAFLADASNTSSNSALKGLNSLVGRLNLENGATVTTSGALNAYSDSAISIDGSTAQTTLDVRSAAGFINGDAPGYLNCQVNLSGHALLEFRSGQITSLDNTLTLDGQDAFLADASNTSSNSALKGLNSLDQYGSLSLNHGATVTTSGDLHNGGAISVGDGSLLHVRGRSRTTTYTTSAGW